MIRSIFCDQSIPMHSVDMLQTIDKACCLQNAEIGLETKNQCHNGNQDIYSYQIEFYIHVEFFTIIPVNNEPIIPPIL